MNPLPFTFIFLYAISPLFAQKPVIDSAAIVNWPSLGTTAAVANDGNYFQYTIDTLNRGSQTLVVQKTDNSWKREYPGVAAAFFTPDSKMMIFQKNDTLHFLSLISKRETTIPHIKQYSRPASYRSWWLFYQLTGQSNDWILLNLHTGKEQHFSNIASHQFSVNGNALIITKTSATMDTIQWIDLKNNNIRNIWPPKVAAMSKAISCYTMDPAGTQLAFMVADKNASTTNNGIWHYTPGVDSPVMLADNQSAGIDAGLSIANSPVSFSQNGKYIFFKLQHPKDTLKPSPDAVMVDVWTYKDSVLQSTQLLNADNQRAFFAAVINPDNKRIIRLEQEDELLFASLQNVARQADFMVLIGKWSIADEYSWLESYQTRPFYLISLKDGSRKQINTNGKITMAFNQLSFSPGGKYLLFYDVKVGSYYSYNLQCGETVNISANINTVLTGFDIIRTVPVGIAGWLPDDAALLIYDNYDIWKVDPSGNTPPVNITNSYGIKHHIKLKLIHRYEDNLINPAPNNIYTTNKSLLLTAFDTVNKQNGFFIKKLSNLKDPKLLSLMPCHIYTTNFQAPFTSSDFYPLKANDANKWIVMRQTETDAPNFFLTKDFKTFKRLTNIQPQQNYNWLTSELVTWRQLDGAYTQGLLYKPENFDSGKKYPLIFFVYEKMSNNKYLYAQPRFSNGPINIPWFVSRGYLVITPDIHYTIGKTGESVCNSVISGARYASQWSWVDSSKMAVTGHSFGGYETNYVITHTNIFAAAASAAGMADFISGYGGLNNKVIGATSSQSQFEFEQYRIGSTLWQSPELYIKNSPIFNIDKVTTPLLITHNKADYLVPWTQSIELFTGLRRLQKKVWMLHYDNGGHGVEGDDIIDFTIRITQFFDHYLKGIPPSKWMTEGIPAKLKGNSLGYELDTSGREP